MEKYSDSACFAVVAILKDWGFALIDSQEANCQPDTFHRKLLHPKQSKYLLPSQLDS
jgi:hypothetical protein